MRLLPFRGSIMPVISFANAKGGAGKTTAALLLATELARHGLRVAIIDCDPQHWISQWAEISGPVPNHEVISEVSLAYLQCPLRAMKWHVEYFVIDIAAVRHSLVTHALGRIGEGARW